MLYGCVRDCKVSEAYTHRGTLRSRESDVTRLSSGARGAGGAGAAVQTRSSLYQGYTPTLVRELQLWCITIGSSLMPKAVASKCGVTYSRTLLSRGAAASRTAGETLMIE